MHRSALITLFLSLCLNLNCYTQVDTLVSVFHHNYLVERHADLTVFAEELVAYAQDYNCSEELQNKALRYQEIIASINVWESTDVVATMNNLDVLLSRGASLHTELIQEGKWTQRRRKTWTTIKSSLPYLLAILLFPMVYYWLFRRK